MWIAGVDGCRFGWLAALESRETGEIRLRPFHNIASLLAAPEAPEIVAIDMPIGLPETISGPGRAAEQAVRPLLGARQSSVFSIPSRAAVYSRDYGEACAVALATPTPPRKISRQGFMLFDKIREIDALMRARPELARRIHEVHPEVAFWRMNGGRPLAEAKKVKNRPHPPGLALRRALLVADGFPRAVVETDPPRGAGPDDLLDALANLSVARRLAAGEATAFPSPPDRDSYGIPIAIWA
jgi:predicted RNase H-like nuclease